MTDEAIIAELRAIAQHHKDRMDRTDVRADRMESKLDAAMNEFHEAMMTFMERTAGIPSKWWLLGTTIAIFATALTIVGLIIAGMGVLKGL